MRVVILLFCASLTCIATNAVAAPRRIVLGPPGTEVAFRAYGLGLLPLDGRFTRFRGLLTYDPDEHSTCRVDLTVEVASLAMNDASVQETVVGPDFIDAPRFPTLAYAGSCQPPGIGGLLDLHGIRRPFQLSLTWNPDRVVAEGQLRRADWGMAAMPVVAGRTVRIQVSVSLLEPSGTSQ